jgi:anti-anti-sigma factor
MSLMISTRHSGTVAIVHIQGELTLGPPLRTLKSQIERAVSGNQATGLVLHLGGISGIDSAGLGELVAIHSLAAHHGFRVALVQPNHRVRELLEMTHVDGFFTFHDDEPAALSSF